jgi:hypothetical protein
VKYVSLSLVKNAGTSHDMWYMQRLSSCRRRKYFIAKLAFSVVIVSSIYHTFSEVNTEHSFQCYLFLQELFWKDLGRILYFCTLKHTTFNFINYTNFNTNLQNIFYSLNGDSGMLLICIYLFPFVRTIFTYPTFGDTAAQYLLH